MGDLKNHFRPEFLNRLDEIIMFKPLTKDNISNIINLLVADVNKRLADKELEIVLTDAAKDFIVENGFDPMLLVIMIIVFLKSTVLPCESVIRPSSSTCKRTLNTSGCAFSTSSKRTTEYGFLLTASVSCPPSS